MLQTLMISMFINIDPRVMSNCDNSQCNPLSFWHLFSYSYLTIICHLDIQVFDFKEHGPTTAHLMALPMLVIHTWYMGLGINSIITRLWAVLLPCSQHPPHRKLGLGINSIITQLWVVLLPCYEHPPHRKFKRSCCCCRRPFSCGNININNRCL